MFEYFAIKGIKPTRFERNVGLSNGYLLVQKKRNADIGSRILSIIMDNCHDLNIEWLITGEGEMIKPSIILPDDEKTINQLQDHIKYQSELIEMQSRMIRDYQLMIDRYEKKQIKKTQSKDSGQ